MQPGWLKQYFKPQDSGAGDDAVKGRDDAPSLWPSIPPDMAYSGGLINT